MKVSQRILYLSSLLVPKDFYGIVTLKQVLGRGSDLGD